MEGLPAQRHVAGDALLADRHGELGEGHLHEVVLRQLEAEPAPPLLGLLDEVDGARVAVGDRARLGEDEREQRVRVALRREAHADGVELRELLLGLLGLEAEPEVLGGVLESLCEHRRRHRPGEVRVPGHGPAGPVVPGRDQAHHEHGLCPLAQGLGGVDRIVIGVQQQDLGVAGPTPQRRGLRERVPLEGGGKRGRQLRDRRAVRIPHDLARHEARV